MMKVLALVLKKSAPSPTERRTMPETAWLIERADPLRPNAVLANSFLGVVGSYDGYYGSGSLQWMMSAHEALCFCRQKDAAMFIGAVALLQDKLPHCHTLEGLRSGDLRAIPVEHSWDDPVAHGEKP
jgi:hypothetical protein